MSDFLTKEEKHEVSALLLYIEDLITCAELRDSVEDYSEDNYRDFKSPEKAMEFFKKFKDADKEEHCGDCTHVACSCRRCFYEGSMKTVDKYYNLIYNENPK